MSVINSGTLRLNRRVVTWVGAGVLVAQIGCLGFDGSAGPQPIPVASISIDPLTDPVPLGAVRTLRGVPLSGTGAPLSDRPVTWTSDNELVATVTASGVLTARAEGVAGIRASSEGKVASIEVRIVSPNPVPVLIALTPAAIPAGTNGPLVVDVVGTGFTAGTTLAIDGVGRATDVVNATTLRMTLSTEDLQASGNRLVIASTPAPGGGTSNALTLSIDEVPAPTIERLEPRQITAGWAGPLTLKVIGSGFATHSTIFWDGGARSARYVSEGELQITIDPQDVRVARNVPVIVETPGGGQASTTFTVNAVPVARVTVHSPWGFAWTWRNHAIPLRAVAEDVLGQELPGRRATWNVADPAVATAHPTSDAEASIYGASVGVTDVEATVDGVRAQRTVRVHETPRFEIVYEAGNGDDRHLMLWDLVTANAPRRLTNNVVAFAPAPSPDGAAFAFAGMPTGSGPGGNVDLFIVDRNRNVHSVMSSVAYDGDPAWSPDGTKLAFTSSRATGSLDVFVGDLQTGAIARLTDAGVAGGPGSGVAARAPAWSPDASQIAYTVQSASGSQLWVMSANGSNKRQLTAGTGVNDLSPSWSPDGQVIVFARELSSPGLSSMVMTVNADGTNVMRIGDRVVSVANAPAYSPDGRWLTTAETSGSGLGAIHAFSVSTNAGPRVVVPVQLGGGRNARWVTRP